MGEIGSVLKRRWPLAVVALLLATGAAIGAFLMTGPTYKYKSAVLLLPPKISTTSDDFTGGNPLFYLGSLIQARDIVIGELNSKNVQDVVENQYPDTSYSADKDVLGSSPIIVITVEGPYEDTAKSLSTYLTDVVPQALVSLQDRLGIRESARIRSEPLTIDQTPEKRNRTQLRAAIVAGGGVAAVCAALIALLDSMLLSRGSRDGSRQGKKKTKKKKTDPPAGWDTDIETGWSSADPETGWPTSDAGQDWSATDSPDPTSPERETAMTPGPTWAESDPDDRDSSSTNSDATSSRVD